MELPVPELHANRNAAAVNFKDNMVGLVGLIQEIMSGLSQEQLTSGSAVLVKSNIPTISLAISAYFGLTSEITLIDKFIKGSQMHWHRFFAGDERFFIDNAGEIFGGVPGASDYLGILAGLFQPRIYANKLDSVGVVLTEMEKQEFFACKVTERSARFASRGPRYGESYINRDNMDAIVEFFHALISICLRYIHLARHPFEVVETLPDKSGKMYRFYLNIIYPDLNLTEMNKSVMANYRCDLSYYARQELANFRETLRSGYLALLNDTVKPGLPFTAVKYLTEQQMATWKIRLDHPKRLIYLNDQPFDLINLDRSLWEQAVNTITDGRLAVIKQYSVVITLTAK